MTEALVDGFGRVHRDLRISVTDRCNLRCTYCMPEEGLAWLPRSEVLTYEEIRRVAALMVQRFGVDSIRLTGGEPLLRHGVEHLVAELARLDVDLSLTTNGVTLAEKADALRRAGLSRLNVSLDSLRPDRFRALTHRDDLPRVLAGIDAAVAIGFAPVKVNCVVMRGVNDDEIVDLAAFGRERGVEVRFIEFMPLDAQQAWRADAVVAREEIVATVDAAFPAVPVGRDGAPAERWRYRDGGGSFGVIASVTEAFCGSCDRVRLTADGHFRNCLFSTDEVDLRALLRGGATDEELAEHVRGSVAAKGAGHAIGRVEFIRPARSMSQIGG